jgi:sugar phosphate isomerase/epimerase
MKRPFALAYLTTAPMEPLEALTLAQKLGYCAICIRLAPLTPGGHYSPLSENTALLRETLACIKDTGVTVFDIEGVRLDEQFLRGSFDRQLEAAQELGARVITVIGDHPDEEQMTASFADLCESAAPELTVGLEFMPYSHVRNADSALRIARRAHHSNARIVCDFLHAHRSGMTASQLSAIPGHWWSHAQLCDAPAEIPIAREALIHTARCARLLPGTGVIDVRGMVQALPDDLPLSIEVPNTSEVARLGREEWARRALLATSQAIGNKRSHL